LLVFLMMASLLLIYKDRKWGEYSFWAALVLFSFLTLAAMAVGRSEGWTEGIPSRYTTFAILSVIGVCGILAKQILEKRSYLTTALLGTLSVFVALSVPFSYEDGVETCRATKLASEEAALTFYSYESQPDEDFARNLLQDPDKNSKKKALQLEKLGYNVFSEPGSRFLPPPLSELSAVPSSTLSEVESISGVEVNQEDQPLSIPAGESFIEVIGWAVDSEAQDVAGGVYLEIDGKLFPAFYGVDRDDLADRFDASSYSYSGFRRAIPVSEIGTGTHELSVVVLTNDKEGYYRPAQEVAFEVG